MSKPRQKFGTVRETSETGVMEGLHRSFSEKTMFLSQNLKIAQIAEGF